MKKFLVILLALTLLSTAALAEIDLSGMTYDELVALKDQINLAIWNSQEWQEVTVPIGVWKVGEDIPEGHWTIKPAPGGTMSWGSVSYGTTLDEVGKSLAYDFNGVYFSEMVKLEDSGAMVELTELDIDMKAGMYVVIDHNDMIFTPYAGKPSLGFK